MDQPLQMKLKEEEEEGMITLFEDRTTPGTANADEDGERDTSLTITTTTTTTTTTTPLQLLSDETVTDGPVVASDTIQAEPNNVVVEDESDSADDVFEKCWNEVNVTGIKDEENHKTVREGG